MDTHGCRSEDCTKNGGSTAKQYWSNYLFWKPKYAGDFGGRLVFSMLEAPTVLQWACRPIEYSRKLQYL